MTRSVRDPMTGTALKFKGSAAQVRQQDVFVFISNSKAI
jgi:hypothetical protein